MTNKEIKNYEIQYAAKITDSEGKRIKIELDSKDLLNAIEEAKETYKTRQNEFEQARYIEYMDIRKRYRITYTDDTKCKLNKYATNVYSRDLITNDRIAPKKNGGRTLSVAQELSFYPSHKKMVFNFGNEKTEASYTPAETQLAIRFYNDNNINYVISPSSETFSYV